MFQTMNQGRILQTSWGTRFWGWTKFGNTGLTLQFMPSTAKTVWSPEGNRSLPLIYPRIFETYWNIKLFLSPKTSSIQFHLIHFRKQSPKYKLVE